MAGADKFGNIYFVRLPQDVSNKIDQGNLVGAPHKVEMIVHFHVGDVMYMRHEHPPLCGRDHMAYRPAYFPVKDVIDGDLCEQFPTLTLEKQQRIANELDTTREEIFKKLEQVRNKIV
ncbi:hypothetical protein CTI12_AA144660 [Artemisia annua]|uniref:RSE1/DDB1/CPSF1 C-terminal domain-containing protein n=1 Tax=Artemisia annua TaxID=35608 RepID=A0A2U1PJ57_ARTAN|nr:hypothetical protein CTI12_AA144660 [Artemisia annua]